MKSIAVVITTPPYSPLTITALNYVESALQANVNVLGVFFYQDGALHANENITISSDEFQAIAKWKKLHQDYNLALHICITAAEKRGIVCEGIEEMKVNDVFNVSGLGELVELSTKASRLVQL